VVHFPFSIANVILFFIQNQQGVKAVKQFTAVIDVLFEEAVVAALATVAALAVVTAVTAMTAMTAVCLIKIAVLVTS